MKKITKIIIPIAASLVCVAPMVSGIASCSCNTNVSDAEMLAKINKVLKENETKYTMNDALVLLKSKDLDVVNIKAKATDGEYVWDQSINRFAIINSKTGALIQGTDGYELNANKWQLWKMVSETTFDSYCQYSQYLKAPATNALSKTTYSFIAGFDCGSNIAVKNVHYFYEKDDDGKAICSKDIIINTNSTNSNVDISAYKNNDEGDVITHYGTMGELTVVSNHKYIEKGKAITCSVYQGEIQIDPAPCNIEMTHVKASVTLTDYKQTGTFIDKIYAIPDVVEEVKGKYPDTTEASDSDYQKVKEKKYEEQSIPVTYVFDVLDEQGKKTNTHFNSLSEISVVTNATTPELFEGKTIVLNKDYDMSLESSDWTPICNGTNRFKGSFDGDGHSIINFNTKNSGMVALIKNNEGSFSNFNFVDCNIESTDSWASLIGIFNYGQSEFKNLRFYNCKTKAVKSHGFAFGYACGEADASFLFENCYTDEKCVAEATANGVVQTGFLSQAATENYVAGELVKFKDCEMHLKIISNYSAGAFVGQLGAVNDDAFKSFIFENCSSYGDIIVVSSNGSNGPMAAGFVGAKQHNAQTAHATETSNTLFKNCHNYSKVYATGRYMNIDNLGGFVGYSNNPLLEGHTIQFEDCSNEGQIGKINSETSYIPNGCGGFVGRTMSDGHVSWTFTRCSNKAYIESSVAGHFIGILGSPTSPESKQCINCDILAGSLMDGTTRTKITGEPE